MTPTSPTVNQTAQGFKARHRRNRAGGSQPQSQQGEGMGVLGAAVPLPYFALPLVMTGQLNPHEPCLLPDRAILPSEGK